MNDMRKPVVGSAHPAKLMRAAFSQPRLTRGKISRGESAKQGAAWRMIALLS
jgi:hypothetical protein